MLFRSFWNAYNAASDLTPDVRAAAAKLTGDWARIAAAPETVQKLLPHQDFVSEAGQWLDKTRDYGLAGVAAVKFLLDAKAGAPTTADEPALNASYGAASAIPQVVGEGVFENFFLTADPALFRYDVRLYASDPADYQAALAAASAAGLPADQVTRSFTTAWNETSAGEYLVIAAGGPANDALYYNVCGWTAPNGIGAGSTPFFYTTAARNSLLPMNEYENGAGQTAANTADRTTDLAYYATHGAFPAGVTTPPAAAGPQYACAGSLGS